MAHVQKPDFVFQQRGQVCLNQWGHQFSRVLAAELYASAVIMLDAPCSEVVWTVLATHSIRQFPFHFPSRASLCAITFQMDSTKILFLCWIIKSHNKRNTTTLNQVQIPLKYMELGCCWFS